MVCYCDIDGVWRHAFKGETITVHADHRSAFDAFNDSAFDSHAPKAKTRRND